MIEPKRRRSRRAPLLAELLETRLLLAGQPAAGLLATGSIQPQDQTTAASDAAEYPQPPMPPAASVVPWNIDLQEHRAPDTVFGIPVGGPVVRAVGAGLPTPPEWIGPPGGPHDTVSTATVLPDAPLAGVIDDLKPVDDLDLYRIPLHPETMGVQVHLEALGQSGMLPGRAWLLDAAGELMGNWQIAPGTGSLVLSLFALRPPHDAFVLFGISHGNASAADETGTPEPLNFEVVVTRSQTAEVPSSAPGNQAGLVPLAIATPIGLGTPIVSPASGGPSTGTTPLASSTSSSSLVPIPTPVPTASGMAFDLGPGLLAPLPTRSAAPSGGVLGDGGEPLADPLEAGVVDLAIVEILPPLSGMPEWFDTTAPHAALEPETQGVEIGPGLLAYQGSGGFPILAAGLVADPRVNRGGKPPVVILPRLAQTELRQATHQATASFPAALAASARTDEQDSHRLRTPGISHTGLRVALTVTFGMLLPELVSAFRAVAPRRRLPRWLSRLRKREFDT